MTHPIVALQGAFVTALRAADVAVFDAPPQERKPPYVMIARHDVLPRDGDTAPGHEHRLLLHVWAAGASRKAALTIAEQVLVVAYAFDCAALKLTLRRHDRTDTAIDAATGQARAAVALTFFTEPN
ncbi:MAG: DUF3168 domain-containing protein [Devosia sp.]